MGYRCLVCAEPVEREDCHGHTLCDRKKCLDRFFELFEKSRLTERIVTAKDAWLYFVPFEHEGSCASIRSCYENKVIERVRMKVVVYHNYIYPQVHILEVPLRTATLIADALSGRNKKKAVALMRSGDGPRTMYKVMAIDRPAYMKDKRFPWSALRKEADAMELGKPFPLGDKSAAQK